MTPCLAPASDIEGLTFQPLSSELRVFEAITNVMGYIYGLESSLADRLSNTPQLPWLPLDQYQFSVTQYNSRSQLLS